MTPARQVLGYTLVELLLVIAILSTLFGLAVPSYRTFQAGQEVKQAAVTLRTNLRFAQNQALSGVKPACTLPSQTLLGWYIVQTAPSSYAIYSHCIGVLEVLYRSVSLPSGTTMAISPNPSAAVFFQPVNRDVIFTTTPGSWTPGTPSLPDPEITITLTKGARSATIKVRKTGDIYE